jgi:acetyltransferase-like isoleucine patch superfamily enzyme
MLFALIAMDLLWALALVGVATPASFAAYGAYAHASIATESAPLGFVAAVVVFVLTYCAGACALSFVIPKPQPGRYPLLKGRDFYLWSLGLIVRRVIDIPPISTLVRQSALGRTLALRAAGGRVSFLANMSSDVVVLDPNQFTLEAGAMLGSGVMVSGHYIVDGVLTLAPVIIESGAEVGADGRIAPGVRLRKKAMVQSGAAIGPFSDVGEGAVVGLRAVVGARVQVGAGASVAPNAYVPNGQVIAPGETFG